MANVKPVKSTGFEFKPFSEKQKKLLTWWDNNSPYKDKFMVVADGSIRAGKEQTLSSKLYTPNGYTLMGDIAIGDFVFNRRGHPVRVIGIYPQGKKDIYEVEFHDGSKTRCGLEHLWTYTTKKCVTNGNYTMFTSTLGDIMKDLEKYKDEKHMHKRAGKYRFPLNGCVEFAPRRVKIDPYLLGLLIGDGCFTEHNSGISFINSEKQPHSYIENILPKYNMQYKFVDKTDSHCAYSCLQRVGGNRKSKLRDLLEHYNLFGKYSHEKFIPVDYKYNSKDVRLAILAGLLNTDGHVHNDRPSMSFSTTSKQLCDDVAEIARSLGMFVNTARKNDEQEKNKHICYSLCIRVNNELCKLLSDKHKARLRLETSKSKDWRMIRSITYVGKEEAQCIMIDDEENLYLTDDFIVTHNTLSMTLSFLLFSMTKFNHMNFAITSKSVGSARRNIIPSLKQMCESLGYTVVDKRSENFLIISNGEIQNYYFVFGGNIFAASAQKCA